MTTETTVRGTSVVVIGTLAAILCALALQGCAPLPSNDCAVLHECPASDASPGADGSTADGGDGVAADAASPGASDASQDQNADSPGADATACDGTKAPHDDPCVIDERFGVFVSPVGRDGSPGTRAAPLLTLAHAIEMAQAAGKRVYVCAGSFTEAMVLGPTRDGAAIYGGFDCTMWSYDGGNRVLVAPPSAGYALSTQGLVKGAIIEDLDFVAQDASSTNAGASSVGAFVASSQHVALHRVSIHAGAATDGASGLSGGPSVDGGVDNAGTNWRGVPPYAPLNGNDATGPAGASSKTCTCGDGTSSVGGRGGAASDAGAQMPGAGMPAFDADGGAASVGRNGISCGAGGAPAENGRDGPQKTADAPSQSWGSITANGWTSPISVPGAAGNPGQGGGGGGNGPGALGGGGSGACGGCGGAGGQAGSAGGSSIALLAFQSGIELVACSLTSSRAGAGGAGGDGEPGQPGSLVAGNGIQSGCQGGLGGAGTGGNGGQGGAGGLSLGIAYAGTAPTFDGVAVVSAMPLPRVAVGTAGAAGLKGSAGAAAATSVGLPQPGSDGSPGFAGLAQAVLGF